MTNSAPLDTMFEIQEIESRDVWNDFVVNTTQDTFHQSWEWGNIYTTLGGRVWHYGVYQKGQIVGVCLAILVKAKRGSFLQVPHGPLLSPVVVGDDVFLQQAISALTKKLARTAVAAGCICVRVAPTFARDDRTACAFKKAGYRNAPIFIQSELSWRLNLQKPEAELLSNMRKSTRYILKRADSYGVLFSRSSDVADFERFYKLYTGTVKTQEYVGQNKAFIQEEFRSFASSGCARFYFAQRSGQDLAAAMIITQGKTGYYHYGASQKDANNTPAPHLLQWHIICDLVRGGFEYYNFWGISPDDKPHHPWRGLTIFKKGFGGEELAYLHTQDYILKWSYWLNWVVETIRRIKRRY